MSLPKDKHGWTASRLITGIRRGMMDGIGLDELGATYSQLRTAADLAKQSEMALTAANKQAEIYRKETLRWSKASKAQDAKYYAMESRLKNTVRSLIASLKAIQEAQSEMFGQCGSNPIFTFRGKQIDCTKFNEAQQLTSAVLHKAETEVPA